MKAYLTFFRMRLIHGMQYRAAAWAGIFTQFFWGFMEIQLYRAFYAEHAAGFPMEFSQLVSYMWLRQAFLVILNTWKFEGELFQMILDGNVAYELCRPTSLYGMWFVRAAATRVSGAAMRFWPILIVAFALPQPWGLRLPPTAMTGVWFLVSMVLTLCVTCAFLLIVYFSCFFTMSSDGMKAILAPIADFLSGGLIPLPFMPDWLGKVVKYSPFGSMLNAPLRIYSGNIAGAELYETLLLQLFWLTVLIAIGYLLQKKGMKKLCVQGG